MTDFEYWMKIGDEQSDYELDASDALHQIVVLDARMLETVRELLTHHELTNAAAQPQEVK